LTEIRKEGRGVLLYLYLGGGQDPDALLARIQGHMGSADGDKKGTSGGSLREMGTGAQILVDLGVKSLRLMTNNPCKIVGLEGYGLKVDERLPLGGADAKSDVAFFEARRTQLKE